MASVERLLPPPVSATSKDKKKSKKARVSEVNAMDVDKPADQEETAPIDEIVDVLIGFLESSTPFSKSVATYAFGNLTGRVLPTTMDFILKVSILCLTQRKPVS